MMEAKRTRYGHQMMMSATTVDDTDDVVPPGGEEGGGGTVMVRGAVRGGEDGMEECEDGIAWGRMMTVLAPPSKLLRRKILGRR